MQEYRLYMLEGGELHWPHEFKARDDAAAIALAQELCVDGRQMELWQRKRKVHCWGFPNCLSHCDSTRAAINAASSVAAASADGLLRL
ncbi:MAG TPA: hypothetical protein VNR86_04915 [Sphingomicrobium sp.]|nr:hypothetical protein [Sphingomicrobium sp.]